jgi:hypothetical protein
MLQVLVLSLKCFVTEKRHVAMQKLFIKINNKRIKKWISVRDIQNNEYSYARLKKREEREK